MTDHATLPFLADRSRVSAPTIPEEDLRRYSLSRALQIAGGGLSGRGTREQEIHDAYEGFARAFLGQGRRVQGFLVPLGVPGSGPRAALDSGTATAGQELVFTRPGAFIDGLRARSVVGTLGATMLEVRLPVSEPRLDSDVTVEWVGEDPGSDLTDTEPTFGSIDYTLHTLACTIPYSRQLLTQSLALPGVDAIVARAAESAIAAELDRVAINGSGASNEPLGILGTSGIGSVDIGANGGAPAYSHIVELEEDVGVADADDVDANQLGFASTPEVRAKLRQTEQLTGGGVPVWLGQRMLGRPAAASTNVPSTLTDGTGTNLHAIVYGNWADLVVVVPPFLDVVVDAFTLKKQGVVELVAYLYTDVQLRHAASFSAVQDADPTA